MTFPAMRIAALVLALLAPSLCRADSAAPGASGPWPSPSGKLLATVRAFPDPAAPLRTDQAGFQLTIVDPDRLLPPRHDFRGRLLARAAWSPDSRYFVMTTTGAGGHSPWHFTAYLYCADDRSFHTLDESVGPVLDPAFHFEKDDTLVVTVGDAAAASNKPGGFIGDFPRALSVSLRQLFPAN